ncbi:MAG TPA: hypothetical protein VGK73_03330 [Polyangiaceae bacterium]
MDARIVFKNSDFCLAVWQQTVIYIWRGPSTLENLAMKVQACNELIANGRGPVTCIGIVERSSPPPEAPVRAALAAWSRDVVPKMAGAVLVAEGSGFRASLVRGVGLALTTLMPHRIPFKFVATVEEAVAHLAPKLRVASGGAPMLKSVIERLRADMDSVGHEDQDKRA